MLSNRFLKSSVGFLISIGLLVWLYYSIEWSVVWQELHHINYWVVVLVTVLLILHFYMRSYRWRFLLPEIEGEARPSLNVLFNCIMVGNFATYILPLRAGEFIRPLLLTNYTKYTFPTAFSSVIVERFFDLVTVLFTFAYVVTQVDTLPDWASKGAMALGILAGGIFVFIIIGSLFPKIAQTIVNKSIFFLPEFVKTKIQKLVKDFLESARVVNNIKNLTRIIILSICVWVIIYLFTYAGFFLIPGDYSFLMALTVTVVIALAVAAPSAPGFIGVYQTACIAGFHIFGYSSEKAITYSIVTHAINYVLFTVFTLFFCFRNDLNIRSLFSQNKQ